MHLLVINTSPYGRRGLTASILSPFLKGVREAGGTSEIVYLNRLTINPCRGDLSCWFKEKNVCVQRDDMAQVLLKFHSADTHADHSDQHRFQFPITVHLPTQN